MVPALDYLENVVPERKKHRFVAIDVEVFSQPEGKLHHPTGEFASLQVATEDQLYLITNVDLVEHVIHAIQDADFHVYHNALYDLRQLRRWSRKWTDYIHFPYIWDTMLVEKNLFGGYYDSFALSDLVRRYFQQYMPKDVREDFSTANELTDEMKEYSMKDVLMTYQIAQVQDQLINKQDISSYWNYDAPMIEVVLNMKPMKVDVDRWLNMAIEFEQRGRDIEGQLNLNVYSHPQVKEFVRKHLHVSIPDTQAETLQSIGGELIDQILLARMLRKATSTYGTKWIEENVEDGFVYPSYSITGTETGRMSCSNPNMQNIPARKIPEYRDLFIQSRGMITVADISQQEPRILAQISGDAELRRIFRDKEDVHLAVGRKVFDPNMQKDDPRRKLAKAINLGTSYGLTAQGLAIRAGISEQDAQRFLTDYFKQFSGVAAYIQKYRSIASRREYIETLGGRRVYISPYNRSAPNNAINAPIQGSAADFTKAWVVRFYYKCTVNHISFPLVGIIHDELVLDHPPEQKEILYELLTKSMIEVAEEMTPDVPFECEILSGESWGCKHG